MNLILERTKVIATTGTLRKRSGKELKEEYDLQSNSMNYFLAEFCDYEEAGSNSDDVAIEVVYKAYEKYCETLNAAATNPQKFGFGVKRVCGGNVKSERSRSPTDYKTLIRVYHGFRFDSDRFAAFLENSNQAQEDLRSEFKTAQLGSNSERDLVPPTKPLSTSLDQSKENDITCRRSELNANISVSRAAEATLDSPVSGEMNSKTDIDEDVPSSVPSLDRGNSERLGTNPSTNSEPRQEEHIESEVQEAKIDKTQTNLDKSEKKPEIAPKFCGDQEYALDKAVIHLQEADYPVNVKSIQTYLRANRTEMANHVVEKYMKVKNL